jgi:glycosyltransferase involved in cell wall biosynthesis
MKLTPKVSIIIPNYNHARFLEQRIESVFDQTYQDFEVILLDDASTDNSQTVLKKYLNDSRVYSDFNTVNSGSPFKQWNKGLGYAKGEYIWIAESDDYADPTLLEKLVQVLDQNLSVGIAYSQSWDVDENNTLLSTRHYWTDDLNAERWQQDFRICGSKECQEYLIFKNTIPNASAVLFRAKAYQESNIANESFKLAGDWLAWVKILTHSDLAYISEPLNYYRTHSQTARKKTWNSLPSMQERLSVAEYIQKQIGISQQQSLQVSIRLANRLLDSLRAGSVTKQHLSVIYRIANLNESLESKLLIYRHIVQQLATQKTTKLKSSIKSLIHQSVA